MNTQFLPVIQTRETVETFLRRMTGHPSMQGPVDDVRWALREPRIQGSRDTLQQDVLVFHVCQLIGVRRLDKAPLIAVKYRPSKKAQEQWMWRDAGREAVIASYAASLSHSNCLNYQWGIKDALLKEMGLL